MRLFWCLLAVLPVFTLANQLSADPTLDEIQSHYRMLWSKPYRELSSSRSFELQYSDIVLGACRDRVVYQKLARQFQKKADELRPKGAASSKLAERQLLIAKACLQMAELCQQLVVSILVKHNNGSETRDLMAKLVDMEKKLATATESASPRAWLTFEEYENFCKLYPAPTVRRRGVLPFLFSDWNKKKSR